MTLKETPQKIVMIAGPGEYPVMVYNYLIENGLEIECFLVEKPISTRIFLKRRIKKLGIINVIGQVLNRLFIVPLLRKTSSRRVQEIMELGRLNTTSPKNDKVSEIPSVNSNECINLLQQIDPPVVVI